MPSTVTTAPTFTPSSSENALRSVAPSSDPNVLNDQEKQKRRRKPRTRRDVDVAHPECHDDVRNVGDNSERRQPRYNVRRRNGGQPRREGDGIQGPPHVATGEATTQSGRSTPSASGSGSGTGIREYKGRGQHQSGPGLSRGGGRRKQINSRLTDGPSEARVPHAPSAPSSTREVKADNLTNRLIDSLRTPPYADCPICFNSIHPAQSIWSCSPSVRNDSLSNGDAEDPAGDAQCCYTPFHMKCIKPWASKSVKDMRDAFRARGETNKQGEWRCPGCQRRRLHVPNSYMCFCGSTPDPRPVRLATPHSCGNPCSRPRACGHACSLSCHPGPCPPCQVTTQLPCHCRRQVKSFRCADLASLSANGKADAPTANLSCGNVCDKMLGCGKHLCTTACHPGPCKECPIVETSNCYCGKASRALKCGEGEEKHSYVMNGDGVLQEWDGRFACESPCGRPFECGIHKCEKPCHPPTSTPPPCPRSPSLITHCPCGKKLLGNLEGGVRERCTDPIMTCGSLCMKQLDGCEHVCSVPCHVGPCPPCAISLIIPCRCGSTTRPVPCHEISSAVAPADVLCDRACSALRACGRHQCNRLCCPLAALAGSAKVKGKKRQAQQGLEEALSLGDEGHWHECDLICGKVLGCGNHRCEERDHRGTCPPCLRSSFEEMVCHCGRTVVEPPIPCGTRISCSYPCSRLPPPCGHPKSAHSCHEDPTPCPPCPFLTAKTCACGKNSVSNIRCSQEKVSCGTTCGKLLDCGFHHCERLCHGAECGTCTSVCGKPRKLCLPAHHGCMAPCHAPAACSEDEPCQASITLRCPCGRIQQAALCGRSTSSPAGREATQQLKCTNECAVAKRNARLADALGISQEVKDRDGQRPIVYSDELLAFARHNGKFCLQVEKSFAEFVASERKVQVLPYMHEARRKFVHDLASIYRIDTQMVDQEPNRSVQLIRRIDTRIPKPLLSAALAHNSNLGKLADLRSAPQSALVSRPSSASSNPPPAHSSASAGHGFGTTQHGGARGWTSVVASSSHPPSTSASAWGAPSRAVGARGPSVHDASMTRTSGVANAPVRGSLASRPVLGYHPEQAPQANDDVPDSWEND
ncbi:hypothetical protein DFH11DRAFT_1582760 [Phellopilus nigrolimitatus]|nr:hypothetical protein DFH11DRAFT_1582760 [Phellopilus nigrolimitatus]